MKLTGVNMRVKKIFLGLCVGFSCSIIFSKNNILWDFGVIITPPEYHNISKDNPQQSPGEQKRPKINAVISDPFIPPVKGTLLSQVSEPINNNMPDNMKLLDPKKNIFQVSYEVKRYFIKKNYVYVIEMLQQRDLTGLTQQHRHDLEYLLTEALYQTGEFKKARDQVLSLLKKNETERLYFLLAMTYESLGENNKAKEYYLKLISQYPKSDYATSAQIKSRILGRH